MVGGDTGVTFNDNVIAAWGSSNKFTILNNGGSSVRIQSRQAGPIEIGHSANDGSNYETAFKTTADGNVELYFNNSKKFETVTGGATITGVCTATSFAGDGSNLTGVSSAEVYGFHQNSTGNLIVTTTNGGADNISASDYAAFEDTIFAATGISFSINASGNLIATIS